MTTVSILITVHNEERFLPAALDSLLAQTYRNFEVVVVNDGSTDGTEDILRHYAYRDPRIKPFHEPKNGRSRSLNLGIRYAKSNVIAIMDSDDISLPTRLERQLAFLNANPQLGMIASYYEQVDTQGQPIKPVDTIPTDPQTLRRMLATENPICHGTVMIRKPVLMEAGMYREAFLAAVDYDMYLRVLDKTEIGVLPEVLYQYRVHGTAMSSRRLVQLQMKSLASALYQQRQQTGQDILQRHAQDMTGQKEFIRAFLAKDLSAHRKDYARILWELGRKYYRLGETDAAIGCFKAAFRLDPARIGPLRYLGKSFLRKLAR